MLAMEDPLLQPFVMKHLHLRNRVFSSSHEPAYAENGFPTERYRLYHVEKAKGGLAMTMTAGGAVVSLISWRLNESAAEGTASAASGSGRTR